jgi:tRNA (guanine-N7-)-methyltransferase
VTLHERTRSVGADPAPISDPRGEDIPAPPEGVRTFTPRWRNSPLTEERMATLLPGRSLPDGPLVPEVAFGRVAPVVVEIGSGHGAAAVAYCSAHPETDLVAVEVHVPGVARMLALAEAAGLGNLWVHPGDALPFLAERVAPGSLAAVHLFFPDPWPKNKHVKRRFVQQHTLALIASRLQPGGQLLIATDITAYAAHARAQLAEHDRWSVVEGERPSWRPADGFEAKGLRAGRVVSELAATLLPT